METSRIALLTALVLLVGVTPVALAGARGTVISINKDDNGRQVSVPVGATLTVRLKQAGATGYSWEIVDLDSAMLKVMSSGTSQEKKDGRLGGPIVKTWTIRALKKGQTELKMVLYRSWEGVEKAAETFAVLIQVE